MAAANAIEQRLELLEDAWFAFTGHSDARIARWRLDGDGTGLVEIFLETQTLEGSAVPDFFLRLDVPFLDPTDHGRRLRTAFIEELSAAAEEMTAVGVDPWVPPDPDPRADDIGEILLLMHHFKMHYGDLFERMILVLMPQVPGHVAGWTWWVGRLAERGIPDHLRFMIFDDAAVPLLDEVTRAHPEVILTLAPDLDMPGAVDSLVRQVGGTAPPDLYRRFFVGMGTAAQRGDVDAALTLGGSALAVARAQGWTQQVAVVHMTLGTILMGAGRLQDAFAAFGQSREAAVSSRDAGDAGSDVVVLQARLAEGAALLQAGALPEAALAYEDVIAMAEVHGPADPLLLLESRRMAAHCHEGSGRPDAALHHLGGALVGAGAIDEGQRAGTTLPWVVQAALRITEDPAWAGYRPALEQQIEELLGPSWGAVVQEALPA